MELQIEWMRAWRARASAGGEAVQQGGTGTEGGRETPAPRRPRMVTDLGQLHDWSNFGNNILPRTTSGFE